MRIDRVSVKAVQQVASVVQGNNRSALLILWSDAGRIGQRVDKASQIDRQIGYSRRESDTA